MNNVPRRYGGFLNSHPGWAAIQYYALGFLGGVSFALFMHLR